MLSNFYKLSKPTADQSLILKRKLAQYKLTAADIKNINAAGLRLKDKK
jgi:hypothetical protein